MQYRNDGAPSRPHELERDQLAGRGGLLRTGVPRTLTTSGPHTNLSTSSETSSCPVAPAGTVRSRRCCSA